MHQPTDKLAVLPVDIGLANVGTAKAQQLTLPGSTQIQIRKQQVQLSYLAALDPWRRAPSAEVELLLKLGALTGRRLVISDNQAINNAGLHVLLRRPDVFRFLSTADNDGGPPLCIALRQGTQYFEQAVERLILNRDQPAILPWMSSVQQDKVDAYYNHRRASTIGPLFDVAGQKFRDHIERLENLRKANQEVALSWSGLENNYIGAASAAVQRYRRAFSVEKRSSRSNDLAVRACDLLLNQIKSGGEINRSNLYRTVAQSGLDGDAQIAMRLKCLDEPYHENFAAVCGCNTSITGQEYREAEVASRMGSIADKLRRLRSSDVIDIDEFPLLFNQVPFARISSLRASPVFLDLLDRLTVGTDEQRTRVIIDLLNFISAEFAKEPQGLRKLNRLRLHILFPSRGLADELINSGLSLSDVVAFASKAAGFVVGETVGWLVGVFGIGGILGAGAAMIVEQVAQHAYERPKKHQEFQQVLQILTSGSSRSVEETRI